MSKQVVSVSQLNSYIQSKLDSDVQLSAVAVRGEISNYKMYPSGHHYFTLKDESATLKCVMFKGNALRLRFRPDNGMKVIAMGKISVYSRDGVYQLYCTAMVMDGIGDLYAAFEQLKSKLASQGLFDQAHKRTIPAYPGTIGIVTSSAGAAVHDMIRILRKRYPLVNVRLLAVRVQGSDAPPEIAGAIRYANIHQLADLLIVGRGGGSIEDLWAFNDERVAQAIFDSEIPVISAVGHEPDVTISDYVADLRAATPSNAAELAVPDQDVLRENLDKISDFIVKTLNKQIQVYRQQLSVLRRSPALRTPENYLEQKNKSLDFLRNRLLSAHSLNLSRKQRRFTELTAKLDAMSPLKVLTRGYSVTQSEGNTVIRSITQVHCGDDVRITLSDGELLASVLNIKEGQS